ncbi:MAG: rod shape-determining protein MreC [Candidatus Aminicenantes bacterium]|nr:rod shape-determining protein MreC [Candidatus Aminicenantes bacterium]
MPSFLKKNKKLVILFSLLLFHMILISIQVPRGKEGTYFESFIFAVFSPVQNGVVALCQSVNRIWNDYFYLREVRVQNRRLNTEVTQLRQENTLLQSLLKNYEKQNEVQEFLSDISEDLVHCRIIGFDMSNAFKSVVINRGSHHGLKKNMVVLDEKGHVVGRMVDPITFYQATVQLITDHKSGVSVVKQGGNSVGILSGNNTQMCEMKYILSTDEEVHTGDVIVTTGHDGIFPPHLKVGMVSSVQTTPGLFKKIKVRPYFQVNQLHQLAVIKTNANIVF